MSKRQTWQREHERTLRRYTFAANEFSTVGPEIRAMRNLSKVAREYRASIQQGLEMGVFHDLDKQVAADVNSFADTMKTWQTHPGTLLNTLKRDMIDLAETMSRVVEAATS